MKLYHFTFDTHDGANGGKPTIQVSEFEARETNMLYFYPDYSGSREHRVEKRVLDIITPYTFVKDAGFEPIYVPAPKPYRYMGMWSLDGDVENFRRAVISKLEEYRKFIAEEQNTIQALNDVRTSNMLKY